MEIYDATEYAYKNGYDAGVVAGIKEFVDKLDTYIMWHFPIDDPYVAGIRLKTDKLVKEMIGEKE